METITITIKIDEEYRKKIEQFDVCPSFEWYLIGVLLKHLSENGEMSMLIQKLSGNNLAARLQLMQLHDTVKLGMAMCEEIA
jgi:hypothetical protein